MSFLAYIVPTSFTLAFLISCVSLAWVGGWLFNSLIEPEVALAAPETYVKMLGLLAYSFMCFVYAVNGGRVIAAGYFRAYYGIHEALHQQSGTSWDDVLSDDEEEEVATPPCKSRGSKKES